MPYFPSLILLNLLLGACCIERPLLNASLREGGALEAYMREQS